MGATTYEESPPGKHKSKNLRITCSYVLLSVSMATLLQDCFTPRLTASETLFWLNLVGYLVRFVNIFSVRYLVNRQQCVKLKHH